MVTVDTVEKSWKNIVLAKYNGNDWLLYNRSCKHAINLKCLLCCHYVKNIDKLRGFKDEWIEGSTNYHSSNALDHAVSKQHKVCFNKDAKDKGLDIMEATEKYLEEGQKNIAQSLAKTSEKEKELIHDWIEVAYFTAHEEISLAKFEQLIVLEKHHGLPLHGHAYQNRTACSEMIDLISTVMADKLSVKLNNVKFFSSLFDGSTDAAMFEKEVSYVQYFDPTPLGSSKVKVIQEFFALSEVDYSRADGVKKTIEDSLEKNCKFNTLSSHT